MTRPVLALFALFAVLSAAPRAASAQAMSLDYAAPAECPDAVRFADEVAARLGRLAFEPNSSRIVRVRVFADGSEFSGMIELPDAAPRSFRSAECTDLVATIASALATQIDGGAPRSAWTASEPQALAGNGMLRIRVEADVPELGLHRVTDQQLAIVSTGNATGYGVGWNFQELCFAPCETSIAPGTHHLAVSLGVGSPMPLNERTRLDRDSTVRIHYESREGLRIAGLLTLILGPLAGGGIVVPGALMMGSNNAGERDTGTSLLVAGSVIGGVSIIVGYVMIFLQDVIDLDVLPFEF